MSNLVPDGWRKVKFKDVFHSYKYGPRFSSKDYDELGNVKTIRGTDVVASGVIKYPQVPIARLDSKLVDDNKLLDGDLVMITTADCGMTAVFYEQPIPYIASAYAIKLSPTEQVSSEFIKLFMQTSDAKAQIDSFVRKGTVANLPGSDVMNVAVKLPPLTEQQKIAKILTSVDDVIEKTQAQIDKLKDLKTGMMQELLTNGIGHTEFKDSPVGRIPAEWEVDKLINLSTNGINNGIFNDPKKVGKGYKLINVVEMYRGFGVDIRTLKLQDCSEKVFNKNKVEYGDVFFTRSSLKLEGIAFCNINLSHDDDITYDGHLMRVRPDTSRVLPKYLAYYCLSDFARKSFMANAKHSTMTTIGQADIAPLSVSLPPIDEQEEIIKHLDSVENNIRMKNSKLEHNKRIKKALMQDLLTGKVRVKVDS